jgi:hypothetical protein
LLERLKKLNSSADSNGDITPIADSNYVDHYNEKMNIHMAGFPFREQGINKRGPQ